MLLQRVRTLRTLAVYAALALSSGAASAQVPAEAFPLGDEPVLTSRRWTTDHGLPQNSAVALERTDDGYLWVGTLAGLARFDGTQFRSFRLEQSPELPGDRVSALARGANGGLWIATELNGVAAYADGHFEHDLETKRFGRFTDLAEDGNGLLWMRTSKFLFVREDGATTRCEDFRKYAVTDLLVNPDGTLYVAGRDGLFCRRDGAFEKVEGSDALGRVEHIACDAEGRVWMIATGGVGLLRGSKVDVLCEIPLDEVRGASFGIDGLLVVVLRDSARVFRIEDGESSETSLRRVPRHESMLAELCINVRAVLDDGEGGFWIGEWNDGLVHVTPEPFVRLTRDDGIPGHSRVLATERGIFLGKSGDLSLRTAEGLVPIPLELPENVDEVFPAYSSPDGALWLRADDFVGRYEGGQTAWYELPASARGLVEDAHRVAWTGQPRATLLGIDRDGKMTSVQLSGIDGGVIVQCLDASGALWFSFDGGVGRLLPPFSNGVFEAYRFDRAARRAAVRSLVEDERGDVWITTYGGGLLRWRAGAVRRYGEDSGLSDVFLGGVALAREHLWINCNSGVQVIALDDFDRLDASPRGRLNVHLLRTGECDGMPLSTDAEGRIWFPTVDGVTVVDPRLYQLPDTKPRVYVQSVASRDPSSRIDVASLADEPLVFCAGTRHVEVEYAGVAFHCPEQLQYRYRLDGYDEEWTEAGARRTAYFTGVPPGDYVFRVEARNCVGVSSADVALLPIRLNAHFYEAWWFKALVSIGSVLALALAYRARIRGLNRRNQLLEREMRERDRAERAERERNDMAETLRESRTFELVGRLAGGIAHDFNNVLTAIIGNAELIRYSAQSDFDSEVSQFAEHILDCGDRGSSLVRQLLAFSRKQVLEPQVLDAQHALESLEPMLRQLLPENVNLRIERSLDDSCIRVDPSQLDQVVMNLVLNARDAMPSGGTITIETGPAVGLEAASSPPVESPDSFIVLRVRDTGHGIDEALLPHIFEPFFSAKPSAQGTGLGLASVHGIVTQSGGYIRVQSEAGEGTTFHVYFPAAHPSVSCKGRAPQPGSTEAAKEPNAPAERNVLVCEDYEPTRRMLESFLRKQGFEVHAAERPSEAIDMASRMDNLELLISDFSLPEMNGLQLSGHVEELHSGLRTLFVSGHAGETPAGRTVATSKNFLEKPFTTRELLDKITTTLA